MQHVTTFGELCNVVINKIDLTEATDCTSQQAFYKLRQAFRFVAPHVPVLPDTELKLLLPWRQRRQLWRLLEQQLGFKHKMLGMSAFAAGALGITVLASFVALFIDHVVGMTGIGLAIMAAIVLEETGKALRVKTVRECVEQMTCEQYLKSRRNPETVNRTEVTKKVQALFMNMLLLKSSALTPDAPLV